MERVEIIYQGEKIATHGRSYEREDFITNPLHYLALLEQKPRALDQAAPLDKWLLGEAVHRLRRLMEARSGKEGRKEFIQVLRLCELERIDRERRMVERRIRLARFPHTKSFDTFDFTAQPSLNKSLVLELARCDWIDKRHNIIALGPSGTGKTHAALALGLAACQKNHSVLFTTAAALVHELMEARDERKLRRVQKHMAAVKLLIIDELGGAVFLRWGPPC